MTQPNPIDYFAIRNTIANYCIALDTKDWKLLDEVFTVEVYLDYPFRPEPMKCRQLVVSALENRLSNIKTQHAVTTQKIEIAEDGRTANATTYYQGTHFGKGKWEGQTRTSYGKYVDTLILVGAKGGLPGASGQWLISRRKLDLMAVLGEEGVMNNEED